MIKIIKKWRIIYHLSQCGHQKCVMEYYGHIDLSSICSRHDKQNYKFFTLNLPAHPLNKREIDLIMYQGFYSRR